MSEPLWCEVRGHYCRCHDYGKRCDEVEWSLGPTMGGPMPGVSASTEKHEWSVDVLERGESGE